MASQSPQDAPYGADAPDGDYMHFLETMLERLSAAFYSKDTAPRDLASISRRMLDVRRDMEAIRGGEGPMDAMEVDDEEFDPADV